MIKITAIGDSITEGFPYTKSESWVELSAKELGIPIINRGFCGDLSSDLLRRFPHDVLALSPTHVIIMGGTNDAFARISLETLSSNFAAMTALCREKGIKPIFGLPVPSIFSQDEAYLSDYREWLESFAVNEKVPLIDFFTPFKESLKHDKTLLVDGVHPSRAGYRLMAQTAAHSVRGVGVSRGQVP